MAIPTVMNGARALVYTTRAEGGPKELVGIFSNVSYNFTYGTGEAYVLGRYSAAAIDYLDQSPVTINATGFRVPGKSPHDTGVTPRLQDLLTADYSEFEILDRATNQVILKVSKVRSQGHAGGVQARQMSETSYNFVGIYYADENGPNVESAGSNPLL